MKTIGIVGGVAWPSSIVYPRIINELVAKRLGDGGLHSACLVLAQTDFEQIERNQREGRWALVGDLLAEQGNKLKAAGADFFLLACNTVHTAADRIVSAVDLPFLHIVDPTAREVQQRGVRTVGLRGPSDVPGNVWRPGLDRAGGVRRMLGYSATRRREHDRRPLIDRPARQPVKASGCWGFRCLRGPAGVVGG
jgi:Asp/Glu/Hydantoin racemase